jgi:hypothetical protein
MNEQMIPPAEISAKLEEINSYQVRRRSEYGHVAEQLGKLYKDIDAGLFGEQAKTGEFYTHIKAVKDANPKPDLETLKAELDALMIKHYGEQ